MPDRRRIGYLDGLVDQVSGRRARAAARSPRRLAWGATRPSGSLFDDAAPPTVSVSRPEAAPARNADPQQPQRIRRSDETDSPRSVPTAPRVDNRPPVRIPERTTTVREVAREPVMRAQPPLDVPVTRVLRERTERTRETIRQVEREPREQAVPPVSAHLPDAVTRAMERLGALSIHIPPPAAPPITVRPPVETTPARPTVAPDRVPERQPAALAAPRPVREEQPSRPPQVHIGSIEVTVAAPPAPPAAAPPPALRAAAAPPAPVGRLSRPTDRYGFGQG